MTPNRFVLYRCLTGVAFAALATCVSAHAAQASTASQVAHEDGANDLSLVVGRSVLLDTAKPVQRVAVGLGDFAEATPISPTEIMVNAKAAGETTLILWETGGNREFFNLTIRPSTAATTDRLEGIRREIRNELGGQNVRVSQENGSVFLRGTVNDLTSSERAVQIASAGGKVVNLLNVHVPASRPQILLKCNFASVDRTRSKDLGINFFSTGFGNVISGITTGQFSPPTLGLDNSNGGSGTASLSNDLNLMAFFPGLDLGATIRALESKGVVQLLSEPNVLAEDGKQGSLLAGGEYPFPVVQGSSAGGAGPTVTIQFKEYGVRLTFLPHVTPQGTIDLQIVSEVSSLDFTNAVTIAGFQVPAIAERRVKTEVELSKGQSFAIGGLLDNRTTETLSKIPYISNLPLIGKFFQSMSKNKTNSELIVIVTPQIVQSVPEGTIPNPTYVEPFLPPNSPTPMHQPDGTGNNTATAQPTPPVPSTMPVEQLVNQMKNEPQLVDTGGTYAPAEMGSGGATSGASNQTAPQ